MLTAEEYLRYQSFKAISEFGRELDPEAFKQARKAKFSSWLPAVLAPFDRICDYGSGSGWLKEMCAEHGKTCVQVDDIGGGQTFASIADVDLVVAICVLEHMTPDQVLAFITTAATRTRAVLLVTNNPKCLFSHFVLWDDFTHVRLYTEHAISALLQTKGYRIDRIFYEDNVLDGYRITGERLRQYQMVVDALGPMMLSSPYNYWCLLASAPGVAASRPRPATDAADDIDAAT